MCVTQSHLCFLLFPWLQSDYTLLLLGGASSKQLRPKVCGILSWRSCTCWLVLQEQLFTVRCWTKSSGHIQSQQRKLKNEGILFQRSAQRTSVHPTRTYVPFPARSEAAEGGHAHIVKGQTVHHSLDHSAQNSLHRARFTFRTWLWLECNSCCC